MKSSTSTILSSDDHFSQQESFSRVAPMLKVALVVGAGGGFLLAAILTMTSALRLSLGSWWLALVQAHGHLQLYGWAGLFVIGIALHFLSRLRGVPLAASWLIPWILGMLVVSLVLRLISQPLAVITIARVWYVLLIVSAVLECVALLGAVYLLGLTILARSPLSTLPTFRGIMPFIVCACGSLGVASLVNLIGIMQPLAAGGLLPDRYDTINTTLGLLGFLVPMALAISIQSLPIRSEFESFPQRILWFPVVLYLLGLLLTCIGVPDISSSPITGIMGLGMVLMGIAVLTFVLLFLSLTRQITRSTSESNMVAHRDQPILFVAAIVSAYLWAILGGFLLISNGIFALSGIGRSFPLDAIRHSFAIGFITLLICGVAPRMLVNFSGKKIASPWLLHALFWLGNLAALLRVGSVVLTPLLVQVGQLGPAFGVILFGLSGPVGLVLALCLAIGLWSLLSPES